MPSWPRLGILIFLSGFICSTEGCYLIWIIEFSYQNHEKNPALCWFLTYWTRQEDRPESDCAFQGNSLTVSTQGEAGRHHRRKVSCTPGTSWHRKHAQKLKVWRRWSSGFGDREVSRDPWQGEPCCQVSSQQVGIPYSVLGKPQCWGVSAFEQEKLKEYIIKYINK